MHDPDPLMSLCEARRSALSRWDNEGGAPPPAGHGAHANVPEMTNAEIVQLRIRVIALENVLIAVLAEGSDRQLQVAREMADYISPRLGCTYHPLTIKAAEHMTDLVDRAARFRIVQP